jgi:hypothetical protein
MIMGRIRTCLLAEALICGLCAAPAMANPKQGAPAPHVNAAPHVNMPAPRPPMPSGQRTMGQPGGGRFGAAAGRPGEPANRRVEHPRGPVSRSAMDHVRTSGGGVPHGRPWDDSFRPGGHPGEHGVVRSENVAHRGEEAHGRDRLAAGDPARAHDKYDEHRRDPDREREIASLHGHDFHVRDVRHFNDHEWHEWRGGVWHRDYYDGRFGWWFDVDGVYYPYAAPIFPFPLEVAPLVFDDVPPAPAPIAGIAPLPPLPHAGYHCEDPSGFYPTLETCRSGWTVIASH